MRVSSLATVFGRGRSDSALNPAGQGKPQGTEQDRRWGRHHAT